ncbi:MAG: hypothetical protein ACQKBV_04750, partial [Puniceicoccales bacterium]
VGDQPRYLGILLASRRGEGHDYLMRYCLTLTLSALSLFFVACGGDQSEPLIDVNEEKYAETHNRPPNESGTVEVVNRTISVNLQVPSPAWSVKIESVWTVGDETWVISRLSNSGDPAAQVITEVSDSVTVTTPKLSPVYYVLGKTFGGISEGPVKFIDSLDEIQTGLDSGEQIWPKN